MIHWIILGAQIIPYGLSWRFLFRKVAYWYVVKPRSAGKDKQIQQFEPDWSDVGWGIVAATIGACLWPLIAVAGVCSWIMARYQPIDIAEAVGGPMPTEARYALLEYKTKQLEAEVMPHYHEAEQKHNNALRGTVVD